MVNMRYMKSIKSAGFTLLELMVAIIIFALMAAIAYSGLNNVLQARTQTEEHSRELQQLQIAMNWLARDVEQTINRGVRSEYGEPLAPLIGNDFEGYLIELTRNGWRNPANHARSSLQRVAYGVREHKLLRAYWRVLDRAEDSKPYEQVLLDGVNSVEIRYLTDNDEWQTSWPPDDLGTAGTAAPPATLPRAVEVNIDTRLFGKVTRLLRVGR